MDKLHTNGVKNFNGTKSLFKAQIALEYMGSIALLMVPFLIGSVFAYSVINDSVNAFMTQQSMEKLASNIEEVYTQGIGSYKIVFISMPAGINYTDSYLGNRTGYGNVISFNYRGATPSHMVSANFTGTLQTVPGTFAYNITKNSRSSVNISPIYT